MSKELPQSATESAPEKTVQENGTPSSPTGALPDKTKGLDFGKLDLTVERVDERLSPSETNIFDK